MINGDDYDDDNDDNEGGYMMFKRQMIDYCKTTERWMIVDRYTYINRYFEC